MLHSNIPEDVGNQAAELYQQIRTDYTENRRIITKANMWKLMYQFWSRHLRPLDMHPERVMYYMMHSGEYMPDGKFIATANGLGIPTPSARSMWFTIRHPEHITMSVVWQIFFYERGLSWDHYRIPNDPFDKVSLDTVYLGVCT